MKVARNVCSLLVLFIHYTYNFSEWGRVCPGRLLGDSTGARGSKRGSVLGARGSCECVRVRSVALFNLLAKCL